MNLNENIFRAYDIRGIYGRDLTKDTAETVGKTFGTFIGSDKKIAVGRDVRTSGKVLEEKVIEGLTSVGCDVVDFGIITTPMLSIIVKIKNFDGGIMISASHNPREWNGFILIDKNGHFCSEGMGMEKIREIAFSKAFAKTNKKGSIFTGNGYNVYENFILPKVRTLKKLKIVLDPGNGATSSIATSLFGKMGIDVISINDFHDGNFPSHSPDVQEKDLLMLKEKVVEVSANFGVGFDCDGDRVAFIDETGRYIGSGNITIAIFSDYYLKKNKGAKIICDATCSSTLEEFIKSKGGLPVLNRVGHAFIVNRMIKEKAILGGEYSNHLYFLEIYGFDDAIFAALKMAEIISSSGKSLSDIANQIPRHFSTDITEISCPDKLKFKIVESIKDKFAKKNYKTIDIDGVKVSFEDGNFLIRASNTTPAIKLNAESKSLDHLKKIFSFGKKMIEEEIKNFGR